MSGSSFYWLLHAGPEKHLLGAGGEEKAAYKSQMRDLWAGFFDWGCSDLRYPLAKVTLAFLSRRIP